MLATKNILKKEKDQKKIDFDETKQLVDGQVLGQWRKTKIRRERDNLKVFSLLLLTAWEKLISVQQRGASESKNLLEFEIKRP